MSNITNLPAELIGEIAFYYRDIKVISSMMLVCKLIHGSIKKSIMWDALGVYKANNKNIIDQFSLRRANIIEYGIYSNEGNDHYRKDFKFTEENFIVAKKLNKPQFDKCNDYNTYCIENIKMRITSSNFGILDLISEFIHNRNDLFNTSVVFYRNFHSNIPAIIEYNDIIDGEIVNKYKYNKIFVDNDEYDDF